MFARRSMDLSSKIMLVFDFDLKIRDVSGSFEIGHGSGVAEDATVESHCHTRH